MSTVQGIYANEVNENDVLFLRNLVFFHDVGHWLSDAQGSENSSTGHVPSLTETLRGSDNNCRNKMFVLFFLDGEQ